jgi:hypothetical protein
VILSVARTRVGAVAAVAGSALPSGFIMDRMAMSASADSDMPARSANQAKRAFSSAEGRAVIEGARLGVAPWSLTLTAA